MGTGHIERDANKYEVDIVLTEHSLSPNASGETASAGQVRPLAGSREYTNPANTASPANAGRGSATRTGKTLKGFRREVVKVGRKEYVREARPGNGVEPANQTS